MGYHNTRRTMDDYWEMHPKTRKEYDNRMMEKYYEHRLYKDRTIGLLSPRAWDAYAKSWGDWFEGAGTAWVSAGSGMKREQIEAIGQSFMSPVNRYTRFVDSRMASTMRQASLAAMHNSVYSLRGALGNEASMYHR